MNRKLVAMALIALVSPGLLNNANAATVIGQSNVTIERINLQNDGAVALPVAEAIVTQQLGEESEKANTNVNEVTQTATVENARELALSPGGGLRFRKQGVCLQIGRHQSSSIGGEKNSQPLPATRGKPAEEQSLQLSPAVGANRLRNIGVNESIHSEAALALDGGSISQSKPDYAVSLLEYRGLTEQRLRVQKLEVTSNRRTLSGMKIGGA